MMLQKIVPPQNFLSHYKCAVKTDMSRCELIALNPTEMLRLFSSSLGFFFFAELIFFGKRHWITASKAIKSERWVFLCAASSWVNGSSLNRFDKDFFSLFFSNREKKMLIIIRTHIDTCVYLKKSLQANEMRARSTCQDPPIYLDCVLC